MSLPVLALQAEWDVLQRAANKELQQENGRPGQWGDLLMRFRKLREGLTATQAPMALRCQVRGH